MSDRYKRNPEVRWREEPGGMRRALETADPGDVPCLTLVHLGTMYQLNRVAAEIWKRCDGALSAAQIVDQVMELFEVDRDRLQEDVTAFITEMERKGWLIRS